MSSNEIPNAAFLPLTLNRRSGCKGQLQQVSTGSPVTVNLNLKRKGDVSSPESTRPLRHRHGFRVQSLYLIQLSAPATPNCLPYKEGWGESDA